jgi:microcystin-dependent protein
LRDRFIVGAGSTYAVDATGGSADATLPTHTHTATSTVTDPGHNHTFSILNVIANGNNPYTATGGQVGTGTVSTAFTSITVATTNANAGTSGTNANLPPYYALAYIMKL